jgi:DNA gyrase subunit B
MANYDASSIVVLKGLEAVRRRPGMYIGDTKNGSGLHQMIWEVVGNVIDEHLRGTATHLSVHLEGDAVTVEDDGAGLPVDVIPREGKSALEILFTVLHAGLDPVVRRPHVHVGPGLWGAGLAPVTALSSRLEVKVWRDGRIHRADFERGEIVGVVRDEGPTTRTGTRVKFTPDFALFTRHPWDVAMIGERLRTLATLNPGLTITFQGETFRSPEGLADHVRHLARGLRRLHAEPIHLQGTHAEVEVEVALLWTERPETDVRGFVSQGPAQEGTHIQGLWHGLQRALALVAPERLGTVGVSPLREVMGPGIVAVVHAGLYEPRFGNPSRDRLMNPEVRDAVAEVMAGALAARLGDEPALVARLLRRVPTP